MAAKKPKMNLGPIDDTLRKLLTAAVKKANKSKTVTKPKLTPAQRYDARKAKGMFLDPETRRMGTKGMFLDPETRRMGTEQMKKEYDNRLKFDEVNERIANRDPSLSAIRDKRGKPITKKQIRDAEGKSRGSKKNLPKKAQKDAKSEGQAIEDAARRAQRKKDFKASGGKNSPANIAKRQQKRAAMRDKNKRK